MEKFEELTKEELMDANGGVWWETALTVWAVYAVGKAAYHLTH